LIIHGRSVKGGLIMKNRIDKRYIESFTYELGNQSGLRKLIKKVIKKMVLWFIKPIGDRQNELNRQMFDQIEHMCLEQAKEIQNLKNMIMRHNMDMGEAMNQTNYRLMSVSSNVKNDIDVMNDRDLNEEIALLKDHGNDNLEQIKTIFETGIERAIQRQDTQDVIVILCNGLKSNAGIEAVRKEAYNLYRIMKRLSKYQIKLVSIENESKIECNGNIIYASEDALEKYFSSLKIRLLIVLESDVSILYRAKCLFFKYKSLVRITGQNPLFGIEPIYYEHLRHLNDMGFQRYDVFSMHAQSIMQDMGFKHVAVKYPLLDISLLNYKKRDIEDKVRIGFASAPMEKEHWTDRGMDLLSEVMTNYPEFEFEVLWRTDKVAVPATWNAMKHLKILKGKQDMKAFYDRIHILLIPYTSVDNNHACSFSALEAMLQGIPVVATNAAGIRDKIIKFGNGEVCKISSKSVGDAVRKIRDHYFEYSSREKALLLRKELSDLNVIAEIDNYAESYLPVNITTIGEWKKALESAGRELVKGPEEIKAYYSQFEVAENYNEDRFMQYPENCIDLLERTSIGNIIKDKFKGTELNILDIAPGDGRIVQEDIKYGNCTGVDASEAMLKVLRKRFANNSNLKTKIADYFENDIEGKFDVITTFRYIRHFEYFQRKILYKKILNNLSEHGILIFDVPNIKFEMPVRNQNGWDKYNIYDIFTTKEDMIAELEENGFKVEYVIAIGNNLMDNIPKECVNEPITWTFGAVKA
jgi:SAM-dependent methyltransferase/glycosyltransferase involved in cell wall biosynthesis